MKWEDKFGVTGDSSIGFLLKKGRLVIIVTFLFIAEFLLQTKPKPCAESFLVL